MQFRNQAIHLPLCNCLQKFFNKNGLVVKTGYANRVKLMSHLTEQKDKSTEGKTRKLSPKMPVKNQPILTLLLSWATNDRRNLDWIIHLMPSQFTFTVVMISQLFPELLARLTCTDRCWSLIPPWYSCPNIWKTYMHQNKLTTITNSMQWQVDHAWLS